jgi:hypothetical protein
MLNGTFGKLQQENKKAGPQNLEEGHAYFCQQLL